MAATPNDILAMVFFARVVQAGSFTGAAAKLGVSKSVVSAKVADLEEQLRVRLLHRTTRKLSLTQEGMALFERCTKVVIAADEAAAAAEGAGDVPRGVLRVNAPIAFAQDYLAAPMAAYLEQNPDVRIDLAMSDRVIDLVDEGVDLAIRVTANLQGPGLIARKLAADRTVLCASPAYLARKGTPLSSQDLVHHDCLVYSLLKVSEEWRFRERGAKEIVSAPITGRLSAASGAVLRQVALAGMGLAVLPAFMVASDVVAGRLRLVVDGFQGVELGIYAVYPQTRRPLGKVRAFVDLLVAHFRTPRWDPLKPGPVRRG
jgi:DNA-binding transcriptional LysR family regulator